MFPPVLHPGGVRGGGGEKKGDANMWVGILVSVSLTVTLWGRHALVPCCQFYNDEEAHKYTIK